ncbi:MAG TPA: four-carbon acid sugar kinase family protein [Actinopolymorphaceae bacterium]|nr:four-carbon acid sugar kinase family protein [Actinopolymorphaceae bacterium]
MSPAVAVVADDLTGAADTGAGFRRSGLATTVTWATSEGQELDPAALRTDVIAIDTGTRAMERSAARAVSERVVAAVRASGARILYKKVDSTFRGHVATEVAAALDRWHPGALAVVAPAFPATGRTTVAGHVVVDGSRLVDAHVPGLFADFGIETLHNDLSCVRDRRSLAARLRMARARGARVCVCDAETDADLGDIAWAAAHLGPDVVWVGSAGLAATLPVALGLTGRDERSLAVAESDLAKACGQKGGSSGPVLVAAGSTTEITRVQVAELVAAGAVHLPVPVAALLAGDRSGGSHVADCDSSGDAAGRAYSEMVLAHLRRGSDVVVTIEASRSAAVDASSVPRRGPAPDALAPASGLMGPGATVQPDPRLAARLGELLRPCAGLVGGLVATGGDTATAILTEWGTTALRLVGEVEPGVPLSVSIAPRPVPVVTKAGGFGTVGTLAAARARLHKTAQPSGEGRT